MCGICGIVDYEGGRLAAGEGVLEPVLDALRHRGPDARGTRIAPPVALGSTRLAVLDLTDRAAQPMIHPASGLMLVYNGEIYNYLELRRELELAGECFRSQSDTEVLLALYARHGPACLHRLRGMFAFAVWHPREQRLFLARDRVGEKPLVYCEAGGAFAFASEIPALLRLSWVPRRVDAAGLHLGLHYIHAPAPWTAFEDIRRLAPGSWLEVTRKGVTTGRWWSCRFNGAEPFRDLDEAAEAVNCALDETTALMSRSDVPIGATLSGGLDSGAVVASLSKTLRGFPTFRVSGGAGSSPAEHDSSEAIAAFHGTRHHQLLLPQSSVASFDDAVSVFGEPIATMVLADARHLAREMKPVVTVALTGGGGDELFGGYPDHSVLRRLERERALRRRWWGRLRPRAGGSEPPSFREQLASLPPGRVYPTLKFSQLREFTRRAYAPPLRAVAARHDPAALCEEVYLASGAEDLASGFLAQQLLLVNQYSLTSIIDAAGMRHALEFRSPFLDVNLIELALRIPARFKTRSGDSAQDRKLVLRRAMRDRLPPETLQAPGKTGFGGTIPHRQWLHEDPTSQFHRKLTSPALADLGLFDLKALEEMWMLSSLSPEVPVAWLWGVATIAAWLERYF